MATFENSAQIFCLREFHENLCSCIEYKNYRRVPLALAEQISFGLLPVYFETFSMDKSHALNSSELLPVHIFRSDI